jgi:HEPN domain-containing protein
MVRAAAGTVTISLCSIFYAKPFPSAAAYKRAQAKPANQFPISLTTPRWGRSSTAGLGRYFFIDILREGILLSEEPGHPFVEPRPLSPAEALRETQEYYDEWFESAVGMLDTARYSISQGRPKEAAFLLHQATERFYHCLFLVRTLYSPKTHNLNQLRQLTEAVEPRLKHVWPRATKFERRCYELLREAYVKARYSRHYRISDEQLAWLSERVEQLQGIVRELCEQRLADLSEAA